jgi:hypothetical protein
MQAGGKFSLAAIIFVSSALQITCDRFSIMRFMHNMHAAVGEAWAWLDWAMKAARTLSAGM